MRQYNPRSSFRSSLPASSLAQALAAKLIGQPGAIQTIAPYVQIHQASLAPEGRPIGVFLLLGPTGTGKTKTVEALAEVLHGNARKLLRVDCGEFQMEHEVAKLIGAPPGYLGHRETQPMLTQAKINSAASEANDVAIVLFDEIEKAAPSMTRLLLGIFDKATLRLGDNTSVNFEKTLIFMTSNLGARTMAKQLRPDFGFSTVIPNLEHCSSGKLEKIGLAAVRRRFAPEFVNRIDTIITYQPLDAAALSIILDLQLVELQRHIDKRLGLQSFQLDIPVRTRKFLLRKGTSQEYGARELKRVLHRMITQPLAALITAGEVRPGSTVRAEVADSREKLILRTDPQSLCPAA
jgi:ATP-dependent Clp protease ATP-binding subunit ClpA